jgi:hypothetical protein
METIEKKVSSLIESQFPEFYQQDGPVFVAFVKEYFKWMEGDFNVGVPETRGYVTVSAMAANVYGNSTFFTSKFANGDQIAIYKDLTDTTYELCLIQEVVSDNLIVLDADHRPSFSSDRALYGTVKEQKNPLYHSRRLLDYDDVDKTTTDFLIYFKEKYLKNIQFTTTTNIRQLIKHALDIYRSKGTERSLDLLFRIVFGAPTSVYYPSTDIFRLSDGRWYVPRYLEISLSDQAEALSGKQIVGVTSGATAYVEAVIRKTVKGRLLDVAYVSAIKGNFITGELINTSDNAIATEDRPMIIGSLTALTVLTGGGNYNVGDIVDLQSSRGEQGQARVTNTSALSGSVSYAIENGGYAYTEDADVLVSNTVMTIANVDIDPSHSGLEYFYFEEKLTQLLGNIAYNSANGELANGDSIFTYELDDSPRGEGIILSISPSNTTTGTILAQVVSGNLQSTDIFTAANGIGATQASYADKTASANVVGQTANVEVSFITKVGDFTVGEEIFQLSSLGIKIANGTFASFGLLNASNGSVILTNSAGVFLPDLLVYGDTSGATANAQTIAVTVGVGNTANPFVSYEQNIIEANSSLGVGTVTRIFEGTGATFAFSNDLLYSETVDINTDLIEDYLSVDLANVAFGFPADPAANLGSIIADALSYDEFTIGKIRALLGTNPGTGYTASPIARIVERNTYLYNKKDVVLSIDGMTGGIFRVGELVTQDDNGSRGIVISANSSELQVERLRWNNANNFVITVDADTVLTGDASGVTANIIAVQSMPISRPLGFNAVLDIDLASSNGVVTALEPIDSGFGYEQDETVSFSSNTNSELGTAIVDLGRSGASVGRYKQVGGVLSGPKKLYDGIYYQEYSYDIRSSVTLDRYEEMLKQLLHVEGTKYFGSLYHRSEANTTVSITFSELIVNIIGWDEGQDMGWDNGDTIAWDD